MARSFTTPGRGPSSASRLRPPPSPLSSSQNSQIGAARKEGSQRSASKASGKAGNSAAPARRPAPGLGPAPR